MRFTNEAGWDRIARIVLGAVLLYLGRVDPASSPPPFVMVLDTINQAQRER
jgi:hypothetical protein